MPAAPLGTTEGSSSLRTARQAGGQTGAQQVEEKNLKRESPAGETGRSRLPEPGPAYRERAYRVIGTLRQCQFIGIISCIWAVSQSVGVGREFSQHQEMENVCGMEREHNLRR